MSGDGTALWNSPGSLEPIEELRSDLVNGTITISNYAPLDEEGDGDIVPERRRAESRNSAVRYMTDRTSP